MNRKDELYESIKPLYDLGMASSTESVVQTNIDSTVALLVEQLGRMGFKSLVTMYADLVTHRDEL